MFIGLFTTSKHLTRRHVTIQYPTERWTMPERSRGIVVLLSDKETGELNCTTCLLCQRTCPSAAITIEYEKDEKNKRHLKDFIVNNAICCYCGMCEEACNFAAIKLATKYEFSTLNRDDLIWHKDKLQEVGRNVPYTPKPKKKPAPKRPAPEPADKPDENKSAAAAAPQSDKPRNPDTVTDTTEAPAAPTEKTTVNPDAVSGTDPDKTPEKPDDPSGARSDKNDEPEPGREAS